MSDPAVSIVILTYNRREAVGQCLSAIKKRTEWDYELIVVDNGSTDGTDKLLVSLGAKLPRDRYRPVLRDFNQYVCARNYGIEIARAPLIAQVDDDVIVHPGWDSVLLDPFANPSVGATGQHGFYQDQSWELLIDDRRRPAPGQYCDLVMGYCWAFRNETRFRYDWDFNPFWHEESDLQLQIRAAGYRILSTPEIATHRSLHPWADTMADRGPTAQSQAERNFYRLRDKWQAKNVPTEGALVGL